MYRRLFAIAAGVLLVGASPAAALNASQPGIVSKVPAEGTPAVLDGVVNAVAQVGNTVIVGGQFTRVMEAGGHVLPRTDIFAFDATTGLVDPAFAPSIANGLVSTLSVGPDGRSVFAGGTFDTVNGQPEKRLVKLSLTDGSIVPAFQAALMGSWVEDSDVRGNTLYIGGAITSVNGVARGRFAAAQRDDRRGRSERRARLHRQAGRQAARGALRHQPRRHEAGRHRDIHQGRRPRSRPDRDDRPVDDPGIGVVVADRRLHARLRDPVRHLHPRRQLRAGRLVLRRRRHRRLVRRRERRRPVRLRPAVGERRDRSRPAPDVGGLHRRRQPDAGGRDRIGDLRRRAPALPEQPVRRRHRRAGRRRAGWASPPSIPRTASPTRGTPAATRAARACGRSSGRRTACGSEATPTTSTSPTTRGSRSCPWPAGRASRPRLRASSPGTSTRSATEHRRCGAASTAPSPGRPRAVTGLGLASANIRGAFMLSGQLYLAWSDGHMDVRTFDGADVGDAEGDRPARAHRRPAAGVEAHGDVLRRRAAVLHRERQPPPLLALVRAAGPDRRAPSGSSPRGNLDWSGVRGMTAGGGPHLLRARRHAVRGGLHRGRARARHRDGRSAARRSATARCGPAAGCSSPSP